MTVLLHELLQWWAAATAVMAGVLALVCGSQAAMRGLLRTTRPDSAEPTAPGLGGPRSSHPG